MITVSHLTKRYGAHVAVDDVSFRVGAGEVVGFLGPNGAGKSTTLRILAGFLHPTAGTAHVGGHDVVDDSLEARRCIGYMPETAPLYPEMRVAEYLAFRAEIKRVERSRRARRVEDAMEKTGVLDVAHKPIGHLSKGYRQRVGIADAIVADPPVVILDEPTAGLDPNQIRDTRALIRELGRDRTVVVSTHILSEVEACATRVLLLHRGKLLAEGPVATVRAMRRGDAVEIAVRGSVGSARDALAAVPGVADVTSDDTIESGADLARLRVAFKASHDGTETTERCVAALVQAGIAVREVRASAGSLEDAFAALTRPEGDRAPPSPQARAKREFGRHTP